jgi:uncharacterized protein YaiI (UPF0178 family)
MVPHLYVDADDCPVKDEVLRVAERYSLNVTFVANRGMYLPEDERVVMVVVKDQLDAADDWIAEHVSADDIVICQDIPLAARCIAKEATVINSRGRLLTDDDIGSALATRDLMASIREAGVITGGAKPYGDRDRSNFLQKLDTQIHAARKSRRRRRTR